MKKKELFNRLTAVSMAAMMTVTMLPANAFASEIDFADDGQEVTTEVEPEEDSSQEVDVVADETEVADEATDEISLAEDNEEAAGEDYEDFSDELDAAGDETDDAKTEAQAYLTKTFITDNKIIINGNDSVVKSEDGLSYFVGLEDSGREITSLNFKREYTKYKSGWYVNSELIDEESSRAPVRRGTVYFSRPAKNQTITATLRLFALDTADDVINDATKAADAALASQDFQVTLEAKASESTMTFKIQDSKTNEEIKPDTITVESQNWDKITPVNGAYTLEKGVSYQVVVKKAGYNDYKETFTFDGTESEKIIKLVPIVTHKVTFKIVDSETGEVIEGAKAKVKQGYYDTINPADDGSYNLIEGTTYNYSVSDVENYKNIYDVEFTVNEDTEITVKMTANISTYKVTIQPKDGESNVENAKCTVSYITYDDDDDYYENPIEVKVTPVDGVYSLQAGTNYTYTIEAGGYKTATGTYTPSGSNVNIVLPVQMTKDVVISEEDQKKVDAVKTEFDKLSRLYPDFKSNKNINDLVVAKIAGFSVDTEGVKVSVASSSSTDDIALDGIINYNKAENPNSNKLNFETVDLTFCFELNGAKAVSNTIRALVGWDQDYVNGKVEQEKNGLEWSQIKGNNTDQANVTSELSLPQITGSSASTAWSAITWISSDDSVLSIEKGDSLDLINTPKRGVIHPKENDTEVTLTATFKVNEEILNTNIEKINDFATYTKEFKITVPGSHIAPPTEEELSAILNKYYTADSIKDYLTGEKADLANCQYDLQLPRYTRIEDESGDYVFKNGEIKVTSENAAISINGYRTLTDVFYDKDITGDLVVTFTREGVTVEKRIPVTVKPLSEEVLDAEVAMMELAKAHYFDGINDGANTDKDNVKENLHAFKEMTLDAAGNPVWVYNVNDVKGTGIFADDLFDDSWVMEGAGYNKFKSSNQAVIAHDNLLVYRRDTDEEITISSLLSSERYGVFAKNHPENAKLQKLYKQPVSVTVTVKGTKAPAEALKDLISSTETMLAEITEGKEPGQYPEGTKAKLEAALTAAKEVQAKEGVTDTELEQAIKALKAAVKEAEAAQNVVVADVTVRVNQGSGQLPMVKKLSVKATTAETYGYEKPEEMKNKVTAADAFYALNAAVYGEDFEKAPEKYISIDASGFVQVMFGKPASSSSYYVNNIYPVDENGNGTVAYDTVLKSGDELSFFLYSDTSGWSDKYLYFKDMPSKAEAKVAFNVTLMGKDFSGDFAVEGAKLVLKNTTTGETVEAKTNAKGVATLKADQAGTYQIYVSEAPYKYYVVPSAEIEVTAAKPAAHTHSYTWKTVSKATVFQPEKQEGTCSVCGEKTTRTVGTKLTATIKLNAKSIKLQKKQTTKKIKVTMANGDSVKSWKSNNKKIVTVNKNGVIKAGKKTGTAKITVTLASGKKATLKVKVQKAKVRTTKITGLKSKVTMKKGEKLTLKANLKPLTTQDKVTWKSSNKKVATVNKKGVITAKKKGTVKITVKSGNKKKVIKVTVK